MPIPARRHIAALVLVPALAIGLAACGSDSSSKSSGSTATSAAPAPSSTGSTITIKNFKFSPDPITVKVGQTVTVKNTDDTTHTVTADDKSFDTGDISGGSTATFTPSKAGSFGFHCNIHNYMTGTVKVTG